MVERRRCQKFLLAAEHPEIFSWRAFLERKIFSTSATLVYTSKLFICKVGLPLFKKRTHSFLLVFCRKQSME